MALAGSSLELQWLLPKRILRLALLFQYAILGYVQEAAAATLDGAGSHGVFDFGELKHSGNSYATEKLMGTSAAMSARLGELLIHGAAVEVLNVSSRLLHRPPKKKAWALYNPSLLPLRWRGEDVFLVTYRAGTWNLCTWDGRGSPVASLPRVEGRNQATSRVMAAITRRDFSPLVPVHEIGMQKFQEHSCTHSTGMRRVGIDDGRLFSLRGKPFVLFAGVAPASQDYPCQHRQYLCPLEMPDEASSTLKELKVECLQKVLLTFDFADQLSEKMLAQDRLGSVHQKNWMPFVVGDQLFLVFTVEPLRVMRVDITTGRCVEISLAKTPALVALHNAERDEFRGHGGPALVALPPTLGSGLLGLARVQAGNLLYTHFFFTLDVPDDPSASNPFTISRVSRLLCIESSLSGHEGFCEVIQFVGGIFIENDTLVLTYGANDCVAQLQAVEPQTSAFEASVLAGRRGGNKAKSPADGASPHLSDRQLRTQLQRTASFQISVFDRLEDQLQIVHADPAVILIPNLWSPEACERLIFTAKCSGAMRQSSCSGYGVAPGEAKAARTSGSVVLKPETARRYGAEALVRKLFRDLTGVLGVGGTDTRVFTAEYPQVVRYERGQRFDLHQDAFAWEQAREDGYQRHATLLVYLNTVGLGGSTRFPELAVDVQPQRGQGLLFFPAFAD
ncbi:P4H11, partial [Symbiodinium sp. CCMP2456]